MATRRWTILVVPQGSGATRQVHVSARILKFLVAFAIIFTTAVLGLTFTAVSKGVALSRLDRLERRNEILANELQAMNWTVALLADTVDALTDRDRNVRLLAGLEPSNPDVLQAGVGGPVPTQTPADLLLTETALGQQALVTRSTLEGLNRRARMLATSYQQALDTLDTFQDRLTRLPSIFPVDGFVSSPFSHNREHPIFHDDRPHEGTDIVAPRGATIMAAAAGRVVDVGNKVGYGLTVTLDHGDGLRTRYAHCSKAIVQVGQRVERGEKIAEVGNSGWATNNHVHYEVLKNGKPVNPALYNFGGRIVD
jgi:murein DD-endopeptidase MepM/ murein hydrolase activator NlpD